MALMGPSGAGKVKREQEEGKRQEEWGGERWKRARKMVRGR